MLSFCFACGVHKIIIIKKKKEKFTTTTKWQKSSAIINMNWQKDSLEGVVFVYTTTTNLMILPF